MCSARVNKAAILQRRQYLDPRVSYVQLNDQRKIKSLASSNGYVKPVKSFSHQEVEQTFSVPSASDYYLSTSQLYKTVSGKFYVLKSIQTINAGLPWYYSTDGENFTSTGVPSNNLCYLVVYENYVRFIYSDVTNLGINISAGTFNFLRLTFGISGAVILTYEEITPVYGN